MTFITSAAPVSELRRLSMIARSAPEPLGVGAGPLGAAGVRRDDRDLAELLPRQVVDDDRRGEQVVDRDVEERLDLRLVQVHRQHAVGAGGD